jgi:hypothetical protein
MIRVWVVGVILLLVLTSSLWAQNAQVSGLITDPSGAVVPNAKVNIVNKDTGVARSVDSNGEGYYTIPVLPPGRYTMSIQAPGFQTSALDNVKLDVAQNARIDFKLQIGKAEQTVEVSAEAAPINMANGSVGTVIDRTFVGNLPLNGRSFDTLLLLTPGVTLTGTAGYDGGEFSVNGQRGNANYFTVDGVSVNIGVNSGGTVAMASMLAGNTPGLTSFGGTNNLVSIDALEEFRIQTSSYSAEYGRQPGGQISLVTRSGGNQFHGALFEYLRNDIMDARNYFDPAPLTKPPLRQNDFGGTFSGPIIKNKTFFFFSYEGLRLRLPVTGLAYVPSLRLRQLAAPDVQPYINGFAVPAASTPELLSSGQPSGMTPYNYGVSNQGSMDTGSVRIDQIVNSKLTLFGRYNQSSSNNAAQFSTVLLNTPEYYNSSTRTLTLGANWIPTPRLSNELRFNYSQEQANSGYIDVPLGGAAPVTIAGLTTGAPPGASGYGGFWLSLAGQRAYLYLGEGSGKFVVGQDNVVDNVSLVKGRHQFKFGVDYRRLADNYGPAAYSRINSFSTQAAVISGNANSMSVSAYQGSRPVFNNLSLYGQDSMKVSPRLTLELGLRWELDPPPHDANGRTPVLLLGVTATNVSNATLAPPGTPFYNTSYRAFAPRFGVAYQLNQTSGRETVVRGGFGVYYDMGNGEAGRGFLSGIPFSASSGTLANMPLTTSIATPPFPSVTSLPITATGTVFASEPNLKLPYTLEWNVALEQALGRQQWVSVSYVGSRAHQLLQELMENWPPNFISGPVPNPNVPYVDYTFNGPTADYDAMQVQYKARLKAGLQALVNYTWSHAIDDVSDEYAGFYELRGNADFDIRHNFSAALNYNLPSPGAVPVLKQVFSHWSVDGIVHAQSGLPVDLTNVLDVVNGQFVYTRPDYVSGQPLYVYGSQYPGGRAFNAAAFTNPPSNPNPADFFVPARLGDFGRNVLHGLPVWQADMAVARSFNLTERFKLQFKAELFNIFNHPNFANYGTSWTTPSTFGVPSQTFNQGVSTAGGSTLNSLYQIGGPRDVQLSLRLTF